MSTDLVDNVFRRFMGVYGNRFTRMWEGLDLADVKAQWAAELHRFDAAAIRHGLDHLPATLPPTLLEFCQLCNRAPATAMPALPKPTASAAVIERAVNDALARTQDSLSGPKAWAYRLRAREEAGEKLTLFVRKAWREALRVHLPGNTQESV